MAARQYSNRHATSFRPVATSKIVGEADSRKPPAASETTGAVQPRPVSFPSSARASGSHVQRCREEMEPPTRAATTGRPPLDAAPVLSGAGLTGTLRAKVLSRRGSISCHGDDGGGDGPCCVLPPSIGDATTAAAGQLGPRRATDAAAGGSTPPEQREGHCGSVDAALVVAEEGSRGTSHLKVEDPGRGTSHPKGEEDPGRGTSYLKGEEDPNDWRGTTTDAHPAAANGPAGDQNSAGAIHRPEAACTQRRMAPAAVAAEEKRPAGTEHTAPEAQPACDGLVPPAFTAPPVVSLLLAPHAPPAIRPAAFSSLPSVARGPGGGGGTGSDDDGDDDADGSLPGGAGGGGQSSWVYEPPPPAQGRWYFPPDGLLFDSTFDSGNLLAVERTGRMRYTLCIAPDCWGSTRETANRQWFHFSIAGGRKGDAVTLTLAAVPYTKMYTYGYTPVSACPPLRSNFTRMTGKVTMVKLDPPPPATPVSTLSSCATGSFDSAGAATGEETKAGGASAQLINLTFEAIFEADSYLRGPCNNNGNAAADPNQPTHYSCAMFIANAHPYSYAKLQRHLSCWDQALNGPFPCTSGDCGKPPPIYFHRELLCRSLDGRRIDLLTVTAGIDEAAANQRKGGGTGGHNGDASSYEPLFLEPSGAQREAAAASGSGRGGPPNVASHGLPLTPGRDVGGAALDGEYAPPIHPAAGGGGANGHPTTNRARRFPRRQYVVLSARVHPGEAPSSHILHGALEFALSRTDPRAAAFRQNFVLVVVPMVNPDGVARGHSRADTTGVNLNRRYKAPSPERHPSIFALRALLFSLQATGRLALYVDMHAHANKKGMFFYGNAMNATEQVQNLLYAKLVSLNSPHFDFPGSNFSEQNMFVVGKNGEGKDGSSRVTLFQETGIVHCYTLEANYVTGNVLNAVAGLSLVPGEEAGYLGGAPCPKYSCASFFDTGRALLVSLLDLKGCNPHSRLALTSFHHLRGVALWVQRVLLVDAWEQLRRQSILRSGLSISRCNNELGSGNAKFAASSSMEPPPLSTICASALPEAVTLKANKVFPPTTTYNLRLLAGDLATAAGKGPGSGGVAGPTAGGAEKPASFSTCVAAAAAAAAGAEGPTVPAHGAMPILASKRRASGDGGSASSASLLLGGNHQPPLLGPAGVVGHRCGGGPPSAAGGVAAKSVKTLPAVTAASLGGGTRAARARGE